MTATATARFLRQENAGLNRRYRLSSAAVLITLGLVACGGGGGGSDTSSASSAAAASCDLADQKDWLRSDMAQRYYWTGQSPNPEPTGFDTVLAYFSALQFTGNAAVPADRWSYISNTAVYQQFFGEGRTLGYGVFVNGIEAKLPLKVRMTEPKSPAALAGVQRGDSIVSINGRPVADIVALGDYAALSPAREGDALLIELDTAADGSRRSVTLLAATYDLTPVPVATTLALGSGRKVGYVVLKDFITQSEAPLQAAFSRFRSEGASEVILDLRYNGGGRVSTANRLASLIAGASRNQQVFTELRYSSRQASLNTTYNIDNGSDAGFSKVVILTGSRTCSASELVINGLKPLTQVFTVGAASCGKPFGFNPVDHCSSTYSAVNFEAFNGAGQGRYYDGIAADCAAVDGFSGALGSPSESLTASALALLETGRCAPTAGAPATNKRAATAAARRARIIEPGEMPPGMWAD